MSQRVWKGCMYRGKRARGLRRPGRGKTSNPSKPFLRHNKGIMWQIAYGDNFGLKYLIRKVNVINTVKSSDTMRQFLYTGEPNSSLKLLCKVFTLNVGKWLTWIGLAKREGGAAAECEGITWEAGRQFITVRHKYESGVDIPGRD